ncbi:MAG: TonB-dependent receptor [Candidatus Methylomirabilis oxyfera]|nr:TonB-dependent receptor [Candidatus Methylomirabilis oxyfera]
MWTRNAELVGIFLAGILLASTVFPAMAQQEKEKEEDAGKAEKPIPLEELRVREFLYHQAEAPEERRLSDAIPTTNISREQIDDRVNRRVGDAVKRMPGVFMGGAPGENNDIRLRGLDKEFTRVQIDNVVVPDGGEKRELQLNRIPAYLIEEVTIIRNPTAEYESDGLAGRVKLKTRPIPERFSGNARLGSGGREHFGDGTWSNSISAGGRIGDLLGAMGTFSFNRDPFVKNKTERQFKAGGEAKTTNGEQEAKNLEATDAFFDVGLFYKGGEVHVKPLMLRLNENKDKKKTARDLTKAAANDETSEREREDKIKQTVGGAVEHRHELTPKIKFEHTMAYYSNREDKGDKTKDSFKETKSVMTFDKREVEEERKEDQTWNYNAKLTVPLTFVLPQELKTGFAMRFRDRFRDKTKIEIKPDGTSTDKTTPKDTYFLKENYFAGFAQNEVWLTDRFSLLPGVRVEYVTLTARDRISPEANRGFTDVNPSIHTLWRATDQLSFKTAFSRAVNRPKFDELSPFEQEDANKIIIGNPDLDPARAWNLDVGFDYAHRDLFFGVNFFHKWVKGVIEEVDTGEDRNGKSVFQMQNVGDGWVRGVELEQRLGFNWTGFDWIGGLTLWANQTVLDSQLEEASGKKRPFKEQPKFITNLGLNYELIPRTTILTFSANFVKPGVNHEASGDIKRVTPDWQFDLALRRHLIEGFYGFVEVDNLTNVQRVEVTHKANGESVRKKEGANRTILVGLSYSF